MEKSMQEQRLTFRLLNYWKLVRKDLAMPEIQRFNTAAIEDIWPQCMLLGIAARGSVMYKYEYMGPLLAEAYGTDLTGMYVNEKISGFPGGIIISKLSAVITAAAPVEDEGHFVSDNGKLIKYRACFLPFGNKKGLSHIVVGLSFRVF